MLEYDYDSAEDWEQEEDAESVASGDTDDEPADVSYPRGIGEAELFFNQVQD